MLGNKSEARGLREMINTQGKDKDHEQWMIYDLMKIGVTKRRLEGLGCSRTWDTTLASMQGA